MSKHHSPSSGDNAPAENATNNGGVPESPEPEQDLEGAGRFQRMRTEIKIGLGTLGLLLVILVGVLIYRIWQMKAGDGSLPSEAPATAVAKNQSETTETGDSSPAPTSSTDPKPSQPESSNASGTAAEPANSVWNIDYSNPTTTPSVAPGAPAWPSETSPKATTANAGSSWAEVDIGQTMLPEPPDASATDQTASHGGGHLTTTAPAEGLDSPSHFDTAAGTPIPENEAGSNLPTDASNAVPGDIPFGPWNAVGTPAAEIATAPPSAVSAPSAAGSIPPADTVGTTPDFFAGGAPITQNDTSLANDGPTAAPTISDGSSPNPTVTPNNPDNREYLASTRENGKATPPPSFEQSGVGATPFAAASDQRVSNGAAGLAPVEPAPPIGNPGWGRGEAPQVPPLAAGNATGTAGLSGRTYTVQEGETLFDIARRQLGRASRWVEIYELNRGRLGKQMEGFRPGITLILPQAESAATAPSPQVFR
ncbi:LysM peptidoglycan-binding domain-containing protein [Thermopirellula anaerolimosa]